MLSLGLGFPGCQRLHDHGNLLLLFCTAWHGEIWFIEEFFGWLGFGFFPTQVCLLRKGSASGPVDIVCAFPVCSCWVRKILALVLPSSSSQSCLEGLAVAFQTWYYSAELLSWSFFSLFKWKVSVSFTLALVMVCMSKFGIKAFMQLPEVIKTMSELIKRGILKFRLNEWLIGC